MPRFAAPSNELDLAEATKMYFGVLNIYLENVGNVGNFKKTRLYFLIVASQ